MKATLSKEATRIAYIADDMECRPVLNQIRITNGKAVASDGFMMVQVPAEMENKEDLILIDAKEVLKAKKLGGAEMEKLIIESDGTTASIEVIGGKQSGCKVNSKVFGGRFPNIESIYPKSERRAYVSLDARYLRKLVQFASIDDCLRIRIRGKSEAVEFILERNNASCLIMPIDISEESELWSGGKKK